MPLTEKQLKKLHELSADVILHRKQLDEMAEAAEELHDQARLATDCLSASTIDYSRKTASLAELLSLK